MVIMPHNALRGRMRLMEIDQIHLARLLKRGITYVNVRLNGHAEWTITEAITMMKQLQIPEKDFLRYFGTAPYELKEAETCSGS